MNIKGLFNLFKKKSHGQGFWKSAFTGGSKKGIETLYREWVYIATDKISETISMVDLILRDQNGESVDHKALQLIKKPNSFSSRMDLLYQTASNLELFGNCYWHIDKPQNPTEIILIPAFLVTPVIKNNGIIAYDIMTENGVKRFQTEEIVHLKYPSPLNLLVGAGVPEHIIKWIRLGQEGDQYTIDFFKNGGTVSNVLETQATNSSQLELVSEGWNKRHQGAGKRNGTAVLPKGTKLVSISNTKDMDFQELDTRTRDRILSAFGVPKSVLGITESGMSRADAEAKNFVFVNFTLLPKIERIIDNLNSFYLGLFTGTENLIFDFVDPTPLNEELEIKRNQVALSGQAYKTVDEVRKENGLPPLVSGGDQVLATGFPTPLGTPEEVKKQYIKSDEETRNEKVFDLFVKTLPMMKEFKKKSQKQINKSLNYLEEFEDGINTLSEERMETLHKEFIVRTTTFEEEYKKIIAQNNARIISEVISEVDVKSKGLFTKTKIEAEKELLFQLSVPLMTTLFQQEGVLQMGALETANLFSPFTEAIQTDLRRVIKMNTDSYTETTFKNIDKVVAEGLTDKIGLDEIEDNLNQSLLLNLPRSELIARNLTFSVANSAGREAFIQSEVVKTVVWHTAEDERVCPICLEQNGNVRTVEGGWYKEGDNVPTADDSKFTANFGDVLNPPIHAQCRCFELPGEITTE
ncbi:MAG: phage portal protein [Candidatus Peribacteraceae bacterium]|nr:phage portal protein [Candidatus Peribacteraceae bacterium]